jgi:hypothetical protein
MRKVETSIRFSPGTLDQLKALAHLRSLREGKTITWNAMVRDLVEGHLLGGEPGSPQGYPALTVPDALKRLLALPDADPDTPPAA